MAEQELIGHTSPETAYVVPDYPYGFRLRCKIRFWIEYKRGKGHRVVSQTTNPKVAGEVWNKPKASTYSDVRVLFLDEQGHVQNEALSGYESEEKVLAFIARFPESCKANQKPVNMLLAHARASKQVFADESLTHPVEKIKAIGRLTLVELKKLQDEQARG